GKGGPLPFRLNLSTPAAQEQFFLRPLSLSSLRLSCPQGPKGVFLLANYRHCPSRRTAMSNEQPTNYALQRLHAQKRAMLNDIEATEKTLEHQRAQVAASEKTLAYYEQCLEQIVDAIALITRGPSVLEAVAHDLRNLTNLYDLDWDIETALIDIILGLEDGSYLAQE